MRFGPPVALAIALLLPLSISAQSLGDFGSSASSFSVSISPQYPMPYGQATLSFLSSTIDLTNASMSVMVAGKNIYKGNIQPMTVTLGKAGAVTQVEVSITSGGTQYSQSIAIQPQDVALVAEPISSAPPLYPGKPSVPLEGNVRVVAIANMRNASGKALDPHTLSYTWIVDKAQITNASGIGKEAIMVASPLQYRSREVSVSVMSQDGSLVGGSTLSLSALDPSVRIYENDPLLGVRFDHALFGSYSIKSAEATLFAAPFSFGTSRGSPTLEWFLNGVHAQTGGIITLRPSGNGQGSASLSLVASSGDYMRASTNLSLSFGTTKGFNLFGL